MCRMRPRCNASSVSTVTCDVNAFVEATPIFRTSVQINSTVRFACDCSQMQAAGKWEGVGLDGVGVGLDAEVVREVAAEERRGACAKARAAAG